jgi:hypothetical protein
MRPQKFDDLNGIRSKEAAISIQIFLCQSKENLLINKIVHQLKFLIKVCNLSATALKLALLR